MHFLCVASAAHFLFLERMDNKMKTKTKTKQILSALLALLMLFGALPATVFAAEKTNPLDYLTYEIVDGEVTITDCDTSISGELTIPETIEGYPVTRIGYFAFEYCADLTNVTIPDSVIYIGSGAFRDCTGLISVIIPRSVTSISNSTFDYCTGLTSIVLHNSITSIGDDAFESCTALTSVMIPDSVKSIGSGAFRYCNGLTNITISNNVTSIGRWAFDGCTGLTSVTIPDSVTSIGNNVFRECVGLTSIKVSKNNKVYDSRNNCNAIIETKTNKLISGCKNTVFPNDITSIGDGAFEGCAGLTSIAIPNSVTSIASAAFQGCVDLANISLPNNIKHLGSGTFYNTAYYNNDLNWENDILYIGKYLIDAKKDIAGSCTVKNGTKLIADYAFSFCESLTDITIPDSVTSIGEGAFYYCIGLTSITIANSVKSIGESAFECCTKLTDIKIPNSVTDIADKTFKECTALTKLTIPNGVKSIGKYSFYGCSDLISVTIPDSVTSIEYWAFKDCTDLKSVTIPNGVTSIGEATFSGCTALTSMTIPNSVTNISAYAFTNCSSLASITIPDGVISIGTYAFGECSGLTSVTIPNSVTSIGKHAFGYRITLDYKEIKIPNFKIYCYSGTAGEQYAKDNGFEYEILKEECAHKLKHITVPASCTVNGMEYDLCTECGDTFNSKVIAALGHSWGNWYISKQPTESADGEETRKCTRCSETETRKIEKLKTVKDEKTGVEIIYKDEFESGVDLEVSQVFDGKSFQLISANYGDVKSAVFDISTYKDGVKVQPNGKIKVRIPLPQGFGGGNIFVCYVDSENGEVQKIKATVNGGYVEFEAEHFSEYAVVEAAPSVKGVDIKDIKLTYKKSGTIKSNITADEGAKYTVKYESSNPKVASVDKNGKVTALKKGTAKITCTVTDSNGNTVSDTCNVTVKYNFGQWLIIILLFGWIWYI